jgi:hypothetical protein
VNVWRKVSVAELHAGREGLLGPDTACRTRWWLLTLECGHKTERHVRYRRLTPPLRQSTRRSADDMLPPQKTVACPECGREALREYLAMLDSSKDTR